VDDILVISNNPILAMKALSNLYCLKDYFAPPTHYLRTTIKKWRLVGNEAPIHWGHSLEEYIRQAINNVEKELSLLTWQMTKWTF
jgi:hypothetical protein